MEDGSVVGFTEHVHVGVKGRSNEVQQVILVLGLGPGRRPDSRLNLSTTSRGLRT